MSTAYVGSVTMVQIVCDCGVTYGLSQRFIDARRDDHKTFYCPNGCYRHYPQETTEESLRKRLKWADASNERLRMERDAEARSRAAIKGHLTRVKKRVANGICPCCNRSFANVKSHMDSQHPDYVADLKAKEERADTP